MPSFGGDRKPRKSNVRNPEILMISAPKSAKKKRKRKTAEQVETLENFFKAVTSNPSSTEIDAIATKTALESNTVKDWFTNRRVKERKL